MLAPTSNKKQQCADSEKKTTDRDNVLAMLPLQIHHNNYLVCVIICETKFV